jgi:hypothetical protein
VGTWGVGIFSDDQACDIRDLYIDGLGNGTTDAELTHALLGGTEIPRDSDDYPVSVLALAATQWQYGRLQEEVKSRALEVIDNGTDLVRWEGSDIGRRRAVLAALRRKLLSPLPPARLPRRRKHAPLTVTSDHVWSPDGKTSAYIWGPASLKEGHRPFVQVYMSSDSGGSGLVVANCPMEDIDLDWTDEKTLVITLPEGAEDENQRTAGWPKGIDEYALAGTMFGGLVVKIRFREAGT